MLGKNLSNSSGAIQPTYVDDVFSAYTYTGNGSTRTINNGIDLLGTVTPGTPVNQQVYGSAGSFTWVVPAGVTSFSAVAVGAGQQSGSGGAGGTLSYVTSVSVTPGESLTVVVGGANNPGGDTSISRGATKLLLAKGGASSTANVGTASFSGGSGGVLGGSDASGAGFGGGGGAGGYSAAGGNGGNGGYGGAANGGVAGTASTGGGGGGGGGGSGSATPYGGKGGGGGGGVGLLGAGSNGTGGATGGGAPGNPGTGGSGGNTGSIGSGGLYGGGSGSSGAANGGLRIIWGPGRYYPSTLVADSVSSGTGSNGGMVWTKCRSNAGENNFILDTTRGITLDNQLVTNSTASASAAYGQAITSVSSNGYTLNSSGHFNTVLGYTYASWTFRKAPKFFDVVTWTGNGAARTISHSLGSVPGMIMVKKTSAADSWYVYHRSLGNGGVLYLEQTAVAGTGSNYWNSTDPTASVFSVGGNTGVNGSGENYVAYLFAHDTATDGIIQCGSFTCNYPAGTHVTLGWEPQFVLMKGSSDATQWYMFDTARGFVVGGNDNYISASSSGPESPGEYGYPTATGFHAIGPGPTGQTFIYLAIRRPNKPPTLGTQVYNAIARTGTGAATTVTGVGFAPDLCVTSMRSASIGQNGQAFSDRLRGTTNQVYSAATTTETTRALAYTSFGMDGGAIGGGSGDVNANTSTYINHFFKRAPGVFDEVCFTGAASGTQVISHNLGAVPEFLICKSRGASSGWIVYFGNVNKILQLQTTSAETTIASFWPASPTASDFTIDPGNIGIASTTAVAYLFATKAGISKVGTYTGNGSSLTLNMGFTTGARFFMCKRTDSTGDWYVFDTTRGIIAGNDGHLSLNTTAAEVTTDDSVDPDTSGLIVNQLAATNINVTSATYIYLAFA